MKAYKQGNIKEHNKQLLLTILKAKQAPLSKRQLADETNLSVVTINKLIAELVQNGEIVELNKPVKTGGRFAQVYEFNANRELFLAVQFVENNAEMKIYFYVVNLLGDIIKQHQQTADTLSAFIHELAELKSAFPQISLVVTGIPGVEVSRKLKIMDVGAFKNIDLNAEIEKRLAVETIIENDINAATFGYAEDSKNIVAGVYFPEKFPPGASLIIHQKVFRGYNNLSGEIKHLPSFIAQSQQAKKDFQELLVQTSQSIIAMYDPQELVIYAAENKLASIDKKQIAEKLDSIFPYGVLPKIIFSEKFSQNYLTGLIKIGINRLAERNSKLF